MPRMGHAGRRRAVGHQGGRLGESEGAAARAFLQGASALGAVAGGASGSSSGEGSPESRSRGRPSGARADARRERDPSS